MIKYAGEEMLMDPRVQLAPMLQPTGTSVHLDRVPVLLLLLAVALILMVLLVWMTPTVVGAIIADVSMELRADLRVKAVVDGTIMPIALPNKPKVAAVP